jgi:glycogen operon protein
LVLVNADAVAQDFLLPAGVWQAMLDTSHPQGRADWYGQGETLFAIPAHGLVVLAAAGADLAPP